MTKELDYSKPYLKSLSEEAVSFLQGMLVKNIEKRLTADQLLRHPWLMKLQETVPVDTEQLESALVNINTFIRATKMQRTIVSILAMIETDKDELKQLE